MFKTWELMFLLFNNRQQSHELCSTFKYRYINNSHTCKVYNHAIVFLSLLWYTLFTTVEEIKKITKCLVQCNSNHLKNLCSFIRINNIRNMIVMKMLVFMIKMLLKIQFTRQKKN